LLFLASFVTVRLKGKSQKNTTKLLHNETNSVTADNTDDIPIEISYKTLELRQ